MTCSGFRARHLDFVDGTLDAATREACERHREQCAACAQLDARVRRSLLLCHNVRLEEPRCDLTARVLAGVRSDRRRRERQSALRRAIGGWVGLAAAGMLVALGIANGRPAALVAPMTAARSPVGTASPASVAVVQPASVRPTPVVPVVEPRRPLPVLGPIDAPPPMPILGDTFPMAPVWPRRPPASRPADVGFISVSLLAP